MTIARLDLPQIKPERSTAGYMPGKQKRGTMKILRSVALAITLASCAHPMTFPAPYNQGPLQITVNDFSGDGNGHITGVSGTATNVSGKYLKYCTISFNVIDSSGTKISEAIASTLGLDSGQSWKFQAGFDSPFSLGSTHLTPGQTTWGN
jgi:hypothetical protein